MEKSAAEENSRYTKLASCDTGFSRDVPRKAPLSQGDVIDLSSSSEEDLKSAARRHSDMDNIMTPSSKESRNLTAKEARKTGTGVSASWFSTKPRKADLRERMTKKPKELGCLQERMPSNKGKTTDGFTRKRSPSSQEVENDAEALSSPSKKTRTTRSSETTTESNTNIHHDGSIDVPSWGEIRPLLEEVGYEFVDGLYCLPWGNPRKYSGPKENVDYFTTELSFRSFLCRNGINSTPGKQWSSENLLLVRRWARFSIVSIATSGSTILDTAANKWDAWNYLRNAGVKFHGSDGSYRIPGNKTAFQDKLVLEFFFARNGVPDTLTFTDDKERVAVELYVAKQVVVERTRL